MKYRILFVLLTTFSQMVNSRIRIFPNVWERCKYAYASQFTTAKIEILRKSVRFSIAEKTQEANMGCKVYSKLYNL